MRVPLVYMGLRVYLGLGSSVYGFRVLGFRV